jgi:hypothetical protein
MKSGNKFRELFIFSIVLASLLCLSLAGCGGSQSVTVEGIIQNINVETQTLQIETRDKKVVSVNIDPTTRLQVNEEIVETATLEPGLAVQVQREGKKAKLIEINLARMYGTVTLADYNELTVQPAGSNQRVTLIATAYSEILREDQPVTLQSLRMGRIVEVHFNPVTKTAFKIVEMPEGFTLKEEKEGSRTEGRIAEFKEGKLTINTAGGVPTVVQVDSSTLITLSDGTRISPQDLPLEAPVKVYFNPLTSLAYEIKLMEQP